CCFLISSILAPPTWIQPSCPDTIEERLGCTDRGFSVGRAFKKTVKAGASDSQHLCGAHSIAFAHVEHALNVNAANFIQRKRTPTFVRGGTAPVRVLQMLGKIPNVDKI